MEADGQIAQQDKIVTSDGKLRGRINSGQGASEQGASEQGASEQGASEQGASEQGEPATENVSPNNQHQTHGDIGPHSEDEKIASLPANLVNLSNDDPEPDTFSRLSNAMLSTLAEAPYGDVFPALIHVHPTSIVSVAKDEDEAVEHAAQIAEQLQLRVRAYFKRHQFSSAELHCDEAGG